MPTEEESLTSEVRGKVILKETSRGIPDLVVVVFDVDPVVGSSDLPAAVIAQGSGVERVGSVATDEDGTFVVTYDALAVRAGEDTTGRPDLILAVIAPDDPEIDPNRRVLFVDPLVRRNAGRIEHYIVRLSEARLAEAGVPPPKSPPGDVPASDQAVDQILIADDRATAIDGGFRTVERRHVTTVRQRSEDYDRNVRPALRRQLSRVPDALVRPETFVQAGESVETKNQSVIRSGIENIINSADPKVRPAVPTVVALSDEQADALKEQLDEDGKVDGQVLEEILGSAVPARRPPSGFIATDPLLEICRPSTDAQDCAELALHGDDGPRRQPVPVPAERRRDRGGAGIGSVSADDIPKFVARLIDTMTSPEEALLTDLEPRADRERVEQNLKDLSLQPSPADAPAFYDFNQLQIAFQDVWQEAIDEGVLDLGEDAYQDIVELGGDVEKEPAQIDPLGLILSEGRKVLTMRRRVRDHRGERDPGTVRDHRGRRGDSNVRDHRDRRSVPPQPTERLPDLLVELEERLKEDYAFTIFAANRKERSVNFGIVVGYRQKWEPLAYQAGKLVKTVTLAPKETRKYSKKTVFLRKRADKEIETHVRTRRDEASQTSRAEQEIVRKASATTNFSLTSQGSVNFGIDQTSLTSTFSRNATQSSDDVKRVFREAVFKSAQEYKDEHTTEVTSEESLDVETIESGEITNPNDELAVTFLFYELQRRYRVAERIHRLTPVVLVAQEVPRPDEIDEGWLVTYDWILRRALLDDSFAPALDYLSQNVVGDRAALDQLGVNVEQQRQIVGQLRQELAVVRERIAAQRALLERSLFLRAGVVSRERSDDSGVFSSIPIVGDVVDTAGNVVEGLGSAVAGLGDFLFGGGGGGTPGAGQDALKEGLQRATDEARDLLFRLEREVTALNTITETYSKALADHLNQRTHIARLRVHVKQNILYYMQAIWSYEPPDQRFFRLHQVPVPTLARTRQTFAFGDLTPSNTSLAAPVHRRLGLNGTTPKKLYTAHLKSEVNPEFDVAPLVEVAELDNLLGFKGNYMIFPLKESNALTDFMMQPYVVAGFNELSDPDDVGNWTLEEFAEYVCCLKEKLTEEQFESLRADLLAQYQRLLSSPHRNGDVLTVPTDSLFIEALVANTSLIERFKEQHRIMDVKQVQSEIRERELNNVRYAARLLAGEREDPDIERKILIEGQTGGVVVPPGDA